MISSRPLCALSVFSLAAGLVACEGPPPPTKQISETRRAPSAAKPALDQTSAQRFGSQGGPMQIRPPQAAPAPIELTWEAPPAWEAQPATSMRAANFRVPPDAECYVTLLPGRAGGLAENLNRWRKQMGAAPLEQSELAALPQRQILGVSGVEISIDGTFTGMGGAPREGYRMRGVVAIFQGSTVFVKFVGPAQTVAAGDAAFAAFCASLGIKGGPKVDAPPPADAPPRAGALGGLDWEVPAGWKEVPSPSSMRLLTFSIPALPDAECYLAVLQGAGGGEAANLERWQGQLGLEPLGEAGLAKLSKIQVLGREVAFFEGIGSYSGMQAGPKTGTYLAGCAVPVGERTLFIKLVVPGANQATERAAFLSFLASLKVAQ